ncbi:hypothetical protein PRUPE_7G176500 [Prunus persica]|uniref:KIB1-4 beta-propeller domain-containing protein n=1 Tax=Prunus persica TaxID=3760 RepID=A0A251NCZ2_PRUPE|nr:hypothetical protein PRUPE_7G176500 [Prunus persica]
MKPVVPWNNLPTDLLEAVGKRLKTKTDVSRFRAICRSWRSSVLPFDQKQPRFPIRIMMKFPFPVNCFFLTITEDTVYHLVPPPNINSDDSASTSSTRGWVVRLREGESGEPSMLHPLSSSFHIKRLPKSVFPKLINLLEFRVFELAKTYTMYHSDHSVSSYRVAISLSPDWPAIMVVAAGKLYHCKLGPDIEMCTRVDITSEVFEDVICFEGKFYAVCHNGTAVVVDPSLEMTLIASPISPDHGSSVHCIKNLVQSLGEIILVERYPSRMKQRRLFPVKFRVYKLNAVERKWVEMEGLDGRILCVENLYSFSVPAGDFPGCQRSCIYFSDPYFPGLFIRKKI